MVEAEVEPMGEVETLMGTQPGDRQWWSFPAGCAVVQLLTEQAG